MKLKQALAVATILGSFTLSAQGQGHPVSPEVTTIPEGTFMIWPDRPGASAFWREGVDPNSLPDLDVFRGLSDSGYKVRPVGDDEFFLPLVRPFVAPIARAFAIEFVEAITEELASAVAAAVVARLNSSDAETSDINQKLGRIIELLGGQKPQQQ